MEKTRNNILKIAKSGYVISSIILGLIGALMIILPESASVWLGRMCGIVLIISGCMRIAGYFSKDLYRLAFQYDLEFGLLMLICGIAALANSAAFVQVSSILIGVAIIADGLFKIRIARDSRSFGISSWIWILVAAIGTCVMGTIMVFFPKDGSILISVWLGISLLCEGIMNLLVALITVKISKSIAPSVIDGKYREETEEGKGKR